MKKFMRLTFIFLCITGSAHADQFKCRFSDSNVKLGKIEIKDNSAYFFKWGFQRQDLGPFFAQKDSEGQWSIEYLDSQKRAWNILLRTTSEESKYEYIENGHSSKNFPIICTLKP